MFELEKFYIWFDHKHIDFWGGASGFDADHIPGKRASCHWGLSCFHLLFSDGDCGAFGIFYPPLVAAQRTSVRERENIYSPSGAFFGIYLFSASSFCDAAFNMVGRFNIRY